MANIRPAEDADLELVTQWMTKPEIARWLDFGPGRERFDPIAAKFAIRKKTDALFLFSVDAQHAPVGVVGLSNLHLRFRTATLWYALGESRYSGQGHTRAAAAAALRAAFERFELEAVNAWAVDENHPSIRILNAIGFSPIGRQRRCHNLDGRICDRLHFDFLASEMTTNE